MVDVRCGGGGDSVKRGEVIPFGDRLCYSGP